MPQPLSRTSNRLRVALAVSWSLALPLQAWAGRPIELRGSAAPPPLPLPAAQPLVLPAPMALVAAADPRPNDRSMIDPESTLTPSTPPVEKAKPSASESLTLNLIKRLVARGVLPKEDADDLVRAAETETEQARAQTAVDQQRMVDTAVARAVAEVQAQVGGGAGTDAELLAASDAVRVPYIPETVRAQMREEIKQDVMAQAREEKWAAPRLLPEWTTRV